jgi:hypothetical protein
MDNDEREEWISDGDFDNMNGRKMAAAVKWEDEGKWEWSDDRE